MHAGGKNGRSLGDSICIYMLILYNCMIKYIVSVCFMDIN